MVFHIECKKSYEYLNVAIVLLLKNFKRGSKTEHNFKIDIVWWTQIKIDSLYSRQTCTCKIVVENIRNSKNDHSEKVCPVQNFMEMFAGRNGLKGTRSSVIQNEQSLSQVKIQLPTLNAFLWNPNKI